MIVGSLCGVGCSAVGVPVLTLMAVNVITVCVIKCCHAERET